MMSGPDLMAESVYLQRRATMVKRIFPFLKDMVQQGRVEPYTFNRDTVLLVCDAIRSKEFMTEVENDPDLSYDLKVQIGNMNSAVNKGWPAVRKLVWSSGANEIAGVMMAILSSIEAVAVACGVEAIPQPLAENEDDGGDIRDNE